ncbi:MAG: hypothetical protein ACLQAH_10125 [Limisphaerales bacterium]
MTYKTFPASVFVETGVHVNKSGEFWLMYGGFHLHWHKRPLGRADLLVSQQGGAAAPPYRSDVPLLF